MKNKFGSFIFTHIPKCGGTSFRAYIREAAERSSISKEEVYIPGEYGLSHEATLMALPSESLSAVQQRPLKVVADHVFYGADQHYDLKTESPYYYTLLREPVTRVISHYNFFCYFRGDYELKDVPLNQLPEERIEAIIRRFSNIQTIYLVGSNKGAKNDDFLARAIDNLRNGYQLFGILEKLEQSLTELKRHSPSWLHFTSDFPHRNKNHSTFPDYSHTDIAERIAQQNQLDIRLYQYASELFEQRITG